MLTEASRGAFIRSDNVRCEKGEPTNPIRIGVRRLRMRGGGAGRGRGARIHHSPLHRHDRPAAPRRAAPHRTGPRRARRSRLLFVALPSFPAHLRKTAKIDMTFRPSGMTSGLRVCEVQLTPRGAGGHHQLARQSNYAGAIHGKNEQTSHRKAPSVDTRRPKRVTIALQDFWKGAGYITEGAEPPEPSLTGRNTTAEATNFTSVFFESECCARGRPIIVEWERDARHSAGLSRSVTHRYVTERYTFQK
ncbi:hypothetical protein EVAR_63087_1 [Eumeta japonica]|uniref:Uncharacterized protein n=1 Tax=Eumeta variegata TaxID=151549 RepID=A0A4C1ZYE4_EUMVA|nr:hypothetical protein EVAR_63087_1 [Eumeta japonica]